MGWPHGSADIGTYQKEGMPGSESQDAKKWKERRNYRKLCADLYICAVACDAHIHTYTYTKTT